MSKKKSKVNLDSSKDILRVPHEKKNTVLVSIMICIILSAILGVGAYFLVKFSHKDTLPMEVYIDTAADFKSAMSKDQFEATRYILRKDIYLSEDDYVFNGSGAVLKGTFNGQGNTIKLLSNYPLFDRLQDTAAVRNLVIVNKELTGGNVTAAILTRANEGLIENCAIENSSITITNTVTYAAGFAAHNFGTIKNCVSDVSFVEYDASIGRFSAGGIAAVTYKGSKIESSISKTTFSDGFTVLANGIFNGNETNMRVGYLAGEGSGKVTGSYACDVYYKNTATDVKSGSVSELAASDINSNFIFNTLLWSSDYWEIETGKLPKPKILVRGN